MALLRDARWMKHRASVEKWKLAHYEYYLAQKRRLAARPEFSARQPWVLAVAGTFWPPLVV